MTQDTEPTEEQIKEQREKLSTYYTEMTPLLEKQLKYEELKAKIASMQFHRREAEVKTAQFGVQEGKKQTSPQGQA